MKQRKLEDLRDEYRDIKERGPYFKNHFPQSPRNFNHKNYNNNYASINNHPFENNSHSQQGPFCLPPNYPDNNNYLQSGQFNYHPSQNYYPFSPQTLTMNPHDYPRNWYVYPSYPPSNINLTTNQFDPIESQCCMKCEEVYKYILFSNLPMKICRCLYCNSMLNTSSLEKFNKKYNNELEEFYKKKLTETLESGTIQQEKEHTNLSAKNYDNPQFNFRDQLVLNEYISPRNDNYKSVKYQINKF